MQSRTRIILVLMVAALWFPFVAFAQPPSRVLDQNQPNVDTGVGGLAIGGGPNSEQKLAQIVTAGRDGALTEVRLPIACSKGRLIVEIQGVLPTNEPDGIVLASRTIHAALLPSTFPPAFQTFRFGSTLNMSAGDRFAIVLRMKRPDRQSCGVFRGPTGNPYPRGDVYFDARPNPPGWIPTGDTRDLPFETLILARP